MLVMIAISVVMNVVSMAMQVAFYAASAYYVAKYARRGWKAGK